MWLFLLALPQPSPKTLSLLHGPPSTQLASCSRRPLVPLHGGSGAKIPKSLSPWPLSDGPVSTCVWRASHAFSGLCPTLGKGQAHLWGWG